MQLLIAQGKIINTKITDFIINFTYNITLSVTIFISLIDFKTFQKIFKSFRCAFNFVNHFWSNIVNYLSNFSAMLKFFLIILTFAIIKLRNSLELYLHFIVISVLISHVHFISFWRCLGEDWQYIFLSFLQDFSERELYFLSICSVSSFLE